MPSLKTNVAPENRPSKVKQSSNHPFSGALLVSGRVSIRLESITVSQYLGSGVGPAIEIMLGKPWGLVRKPFQELVVRCYATAWQGIDFSRICRQSIKNGIINEHEVYLYILILHIYSIIHIHVIYILHITYYILHITYYILHIITICMVAESDGFFSQPQPP